MSDIKPAEVSAILKKQLEGLSLNSKMDEGAALTLAMELRVYGLSNAQYGELVSFQTGLEMVSNLRKTM